MDKQTGARLRLIEARLEALEAAVRPKPIRRTKTGLPRAPEPYEPGDDTPTTDWLALRLMAFENLFGFVLQADAQRISEPADAEIPLHDLADFTLGDLEEAADGMEADPTDFGVRLLRAMVREMRAILADQTRWANAEEADAPA